MSHKLIHSTRRTEIVLLVLVAAALTAILFGATTAGGHPVLIAPNGCSSCKIISA